MLGAARAAARAIRLALVEDNIYAAQKVLSAYQGPSRLPLTALVHGTIRTRRPMAAAIAVESHLENAKTLRVQSLQAYITSLSSTEPQIIPAETAHTPVTTALTVLAAARRSRQQQRTTHMYDAAIRACLFQGELLTGSLLFVLLVRDWQNRHRDTPAAPPDPVPDPTPIAPSPLQKWNRSFPTSFTSPIPPESPTPPFPSPHLLEAIVTALDLRPRPHPQTTHDLPPGRPPDSILALAHLARLFTDQALPFSRHAALLNALARTPPTADKVESYFHGVLRQTCRHPPLMDTRSYNVLINYSLSMVRRPAWAERLVDHMSTVRTPPVRITDTTRAIIARGEAKLREPGLAARILSHIDARGHSTRLPTNSAPPAPPRNPVQDIEDLPRDPHLLAAHVHNLTSLGTPEQVLRLVNTLLPNLHIPPTDVNPRNQHTLRRVLELGPTVLTSLLNALCKSGKTGLAERLHRYSVLAEQISPSFGLPLAFHTTMLQLYAREARKGLVVVEPKPSPLAPPHKAKAIVDAGSLLSPTPGLARSIVDGWGYDVPTPGGRTRRGIKRWALARGAAAHIYLTYIRSRLPLPTHAQPHYQPDARLYNSLFDVFGRRPNMLLRTYLSNIARARDKRHRGKSGAPKQADAFVQVIVKDMVDVGMQEEVPGGWSHFIPINRATFDYSARNVLETANRIRNPVVPSGRWRVREARLRTRFRPNQRAELWRHLVSQRKQTQFLQILAYERAKPQRRLSHHIGNLVKDFRRDLAEGQKALDREIHLNGVDEYRERIHARRKENKKTRKELRRARVEMQRAIARFELGMKDGKSQKQRVRKRWLVAQDKVKRLEELKLKAGQYFEVRLGKDRTVSRQRPGNSTIPRKPSAPRKPVKPGKRGTPSTRKIAPMSIKAKSGRPAKRGSAEQKNRKRVAARS
ncbi:hypothetical protein ACGC1H_001029 [Rhizoctonia solani]|uniref:Uncharacterized protein n=1 Tax=Rhizoctonia solani TaxID=456999 RepID=A0A8H3GDN2_9AGAM|nr:unnamed protein product [Rhizoctonia solani]